MKIKLRLQSGLEHLSKSLVLVENEISSNEADIREHVRRLDEKCRWCGCKVASTERAGDVLYVDVVKSAPEEMILG